MKLLHIVRHAKSSWDDSTLDDFDRPLNDRGNRDAPRMAKRLKESGIHPDLLLTSPAKRALTTCLMMAKVLMIPPENIKQEERLYHADEDQILAILKKVNDHCSSVMVFGHNPGLTEFVNQLMNESIFNIPTCGVAACELKIKSWSELDWGTGKMLFYDYSKKK